jgi:hypothetical protein
MTKKFFEKMFLKPEYSLAVLHMPEDLYDVLKTENKSDGELKNMYNFILAFYTKKTDLENEISLLRKSLSENGLLWIAYPKAKALDTDLNRDILHSATAKYGLDGISLISLNETWSAMRFKRLN